MGLAPDVPVFGAQHRLPGMTVNKEKVSFSKNFPPGVAATL